MRLNTFYQKILETGVISTELNTQRLLRIVLSWDGEGEGKCFSKMGDICRILFVGVIALVVGVLAQYDPYLVGYRTTIVHLFE